MSEYVFISQLTLLENNPRTISTTQFDKLVKSLVEDPKFLEKRPVLVNKIGDELLVYAGNQRVRAAQSLGWKQICCDIEEDVDIDIMKSRVIKDNKTYGSFDDDLLFGHYDEELLLDAGFLPIELDGSIQSLDEMEEKSPEKKQKKLKVCPNCSHEF